ncbi:MAG: hypothetical protein HYY23_12510 [Verrucomicrobia bacterium]|nr:hypothetical protein [Verrucomicrobiota bacterium]
MMHGTDNNKSPNEEQRPGANPKAAHRLASDSPNCAEHQVAWEDEIRLNHLLHHLPDAPLPSNFTARVLSLAEQEADRRTPSALPGRWQSFTQVLLSMRWSARLAILSAIVAIGLVSVYQYQILARQEVARSVAEVSSVASLPMDVLMNFEAIQRLPEKSREVDVELLAALK